MSRERFYQVVTITLSNGKIGSFTGKELVLAKETSSARVTDVFFSEGKELPSGAYFEQLEETLDNES